ncbi:MAG: dienelactone hydrolase family protein [Burkholderiales bacterium]|nr:MAG: dienelactone hydrolase family protein [Burkholderiales bacterium]
MTLSLLRLALFVLLCRGAWAGSRPVEIDAQGLKLGAVVYEPEGVGPFPAVVMLHGCSGLYTSGGGLGAIYRLWAERLAAEGYVGLLVDSFGGRGIEEICTQARRGLSAARDRAQDAYAGLDWLAAQAKVDRTRVYLLGWSNGGAAVLGAVDADAAILKERKAGFRAAVAMYPGCRGFVRKSGYRPAAPLLIQIGEADDWTPAERCRELLASVPAGSGKVDLVIYPEAHHAFDRPGNKPIYREQVWNAARGARGATVGGHPKARAAAVEKALEFLKTH